MTRSKEGGSVDSFERNPRGDEDLGKALLSCFALLVLLNYRDFTIHGMSNI
jgi:hypothetical protein